MGQQEVSMGGQRESLGIASGDFQLEANAKQILYGLASQKTIMNLARTIVGSK
jgi:hypothetical protein